ncbi:MAG: ribosome maturation factor RimM [Sphaerochaetaceae bacterium]|jgi:16S rRNA processing protein RimM|nr:ribosome maturation factor RimM [Sphaerochaetaceae bacterium]MDC7238196.1 ribosome maturation factor RimM [Sphaerochaetaceae bacterium]MDC7244140.1 ribosome maturation factor RimM [Sphaerochaetaceae bacterium]MDC7249992.1 ribosome maturation factor RimM [Sphaerochaetaceae bacterium]
MEKLATAIIQTSYGLKGEVKVRPFNDDCSYLKKLKQGIILLKDGREKTYAIEGFRKSGSQAYMKFSGVDDPETAKKLAGATLFVPKSDAAPLKKGEYYVSDLLGCTLMHEGKPMAKVVGYFDGPQALLLEVEDGSNKRFLVPLLDQYVGKVSIEDKTIELLTQWLLA